MQSVRVEPLITVGATVTRSTKPSEKYALGVASCLGLHCGRACQKFLLYYTS